MAETKHPHFPSGDWEGFYNDPRGSRYADENGIWGKWAIKKWRSGEFHIWPKKRGAGENNEEVKEAVNEAAGTMSYI
jgi:hypothetical protein